PGKAIPWVLRSSSVNSLLRAHRDDRIDARGATCRDIARQCRHGDEYRRDPRIGERIRGRDSVEEGRDEPRHRVGADYTRYDAQEGEGQALADDEPHNALTLRAERDPDAELARPLAHGIRDDAVDA